MTMEILHYSNGFVGIMQRWKSHMWCHCKYCMHVHCALQMLCNLLRGCHLVHVVHNLVGESVTKSCSDQLLHSDGEAASKPLVPNGQEGERWGGDG